MAGEGVQVDPLSVLTTRIERLRKELAAAEEAREAIWRGRVEPSAEGATRGAKRAALIDEVRSWEYALRTFVHQLRAMEQPFSVSMARSVTRMTSRTVHRYLRDGVKRRLLKRLEQGLYRVV